MTPQVNVKTHRSETLLSLVQAWLIMHLHLWQHGGSEVVTTRMSWVCVGFAYFPHRFLLSALIASVNTLGCALGCVEPSADSGVEIILRQRLHVIH